MPAIVFIFVTVILILMIVRLINECCEWFSSRTENPSQPNGCHAINVRIELVLDGHPDYNAVALQRVHRNRDEGSSQYCSGCGCVVWT
ncbi:hypothetical protein DPMN_052759, partial [Dreissena polymorpha]